MKITSTNIAKFFAFLIFFSLSFTSHAKGTEKEINIKKNYVVTMTTNFGVVSFMLLNETPIHRDNFVKLVNEKFYDGVLFHRILDNFMIQAGDPMTKTDRSDAARANYGNDAGYTLPAEILPQFYHYRGAVAAARDTANNLEKLSSGIQFYIVQKPATNEPIDINKVGQRKQTPQVTANYTKRGGTPHLDGNFTIFGYVLEGMDVVDKIAKVKCDKKGKSLKEDVEIKGTKLVKMNRKKIDKKYKHYAK